jgi:endonuclease/exonuclease/phosphatase (EEP) superfamily protein YafD
MQIARLGFHGMTGHDRRRGSLGADTSALLLVLIFAGCMNPPRDAPAGPHFSLLTYNVDFEMEHPEDTLAVIERSAADIVVLQEVSPPWARKILDRLPDAYPYMAIRPYSRTDGLVVLSRFPFESDAYIPSPSHEYPAWLVTVATPLGSVHVLVVHLHPPVGGSEGFSLTELMRGHTDRLNETTRYLRYMPKSGARIVAGDFNENNAGPSVRLLKTNGYTDALAQYDSWSHTWSPFARMRFVGVRLDHILCSGPLACYDARVLGYGGSDHRAVIASFTMAPRR